MCDDLNKDDNMDVDDKRTQAIDDNLKEKYKCVKNYNIQDICIILKNIGYFKQKRRVN